MMNKKGMGGRRDAKGGKEREREREIRMGRREREIGEQGDIVMKTLSRDISFITGMW